MMRNLVVCCDGTWGAPGHRDRDKITVTNVVKIARAVRLDNLTTTEQLRYYHTGVGTTGGFLSRAWAGITGDGLGANIQDAYRWLCDTYTVGDRLFFFGFSRGAYTVRSLAGMIRKCGLPTEPGDFDVRAAWRFYRNGAHPTCDGAKRWRFAHKMSEPEIEFIGVWDTVGALGIPGHWHYKRRYAFHDVQLSSHIVHACQALAIDEHRRLFLPSLWACDTEQTTPTGRRQVVMQRWFSGSHENVGGGYADTNLSNIAYSMIARAASRCGLQLLDNPTACSPFGELRNSFSPLYWPMGRVYRPIGRHWSESISRAARTRFDDATAPDYTATIVPNLARAFETYRGGRWVE